MSMIKEICFPVFLAVIKKCHFSLSVVLTFFWVVAASFVAYIVSFFKKNRLLILIIYTFVLYSPCAFELRMGTRLYRNAMLAPVCFIIFTLMIIILQKILNDKTHFHKIGVFELALGLFFPLGYYIKEDGIWLFAILVFFTILWYCCLFFMRFYKKQKIFTKKTIILCVLFVIPILSFFAITSLYKSVNKKYFGVYATNDRTNGELGKFVNNIYAIQSEGRSAFVWAPKDAIDKAFSVSDTLKSNESLYNAIVHTPWFGGDISINPITGDFLTWVLRDAIVKSGEWTNRTQIQQYFQIVNKELNMAFKKGILKKSKRIQIVSSMGGMNVAELKQNIKSTLKTIMYHLTLHNYDYGSVFHVGTNRQANDIASILIDRDISPLTSEYLIHHRNTEITISNRIIKNIFSIYSTVQPFLFLISFFTTLFSFVIFMKNLVCRKIIDINILLLSLYGFFMLGIAFSYVFAVSWFCTPMPIPWVTVFYSVSIVPALMLFEICGILLLIKLISENRKIFYSWRIGLPSIFPFMDKRH